MKRAFVGFALAIVASQGFVTESAQANMLYSPYFRYLFPSKNNNDLCRPLHTMKYGDQEITLFVKERAHQFGVKMKRHSIVIQTIERRPITARRSISDDGRVFQYWKMPSRRDEPDILLGYTSDPNIVQVRLKVADDDLQKLRLYNGRYFYCVLNPYQGQIEAQGMNADGKILRTWSGKSDYPARRTWLSFFIQTYPYVVS